jgi:FkbM family methyltransferase
MNARPSLIDRLFRAYLKAGWRGFIFLWQMNGRSFQSTLRSETSMGAIFELSPFGYIDGIVLREGYYETEVMEAIASVLDDGILWDIGANFGLHCLTAKHRFPRSRVICFEPSIEMLSRLWRNRALNGLEVDILGIALSNKQGIQTFHLGPSGNPGMSTLSPWLPSAFLETCLVATARGDDLIAQQIVPAPTVIKLDVEGHETAVLEGLSDTLHSPSLRAVVFEDSSEHETPIKTLLRNAGFRSVLLSRTEKSQHNLENFIALRSPSGN